MGPCKAKLPEVKLLEAKSIEARLLEAKLPDCRTSRSFAVTALQMSIRAYQTFLSPLMFSSCRYYPTCSHYAYDAMEMHGAVHGAWLTIRRLLRCHPFSRGGFDPVPAASSAAAQLRIPVSIVGHSIAGHSTAGHSTAGHSPVYQEWAANQERAANKK